MSELRRDPIGGRWVIIDTDHPSLPKDYEYEPHILKGGTCPFCYGNETMTPPEIEAIRNHNTSANTPGWEVRVVPNKFPALKIEGDIDRRGLGIYDLSNGVGAHEVLIETPYHEKDIPDLLDKEVENFLSMYCRRSSDLKKDPRFKYIMIFKNYGAAAGASLEHPHTQIVALPMVPKNVMEEIKGAHHYFEFRERCVFCDILKQEAQEKERIILENKYFLSFCPFVSRFPFEIWIMPKKHQSYFCQTKGDELPQLASILRETISKFKAVFPNPSYNFIIHSSPIGEQEELEGYHWHIEFMPKLTRVAGFESGSGFYLVPTPPELAAKYLRGGKQA
ncbi:MAG: galactose-1-phosphate uridylyltransferase [Candidatus Omnitrophota bacterium]|nr:MAG: galactose-1-phosphate uridylyltransferase [Candidatus Omnitrophota bacterium]